jgi:hypothetical protein
VGTERISVATLFFVSVNASEDEELDRLLTRMSTEPNSATTRSTVAATCARSVTSHLIAAELLDLVRGLARP